MKFTVSARSKPSAVPIQKYVKHNYAGVPAEQIESFFGFVEASPLYGGRIFSTPELSAYDIRSMYKMGINLRLPLTNHTVSKEEYEQNQWLLEKHHRPGNAAIVTNDKLAKWIKADFPDYRVEASVIKNINTLKKLDKALEVYDIVIPPMASNEDETFLNGIEDKSRITLFANAGCALTCPSKMCYPSISKVNKTGDRDLFTCSQGLKQREQLGMIDFDLDHLQSLGFDSFKLLRARPGKMTGY